MPFISDSLKASAPERNIIALNRITFGATTAELNRVNKGGLHGFIEDQLYPSESNDDKVIQKIASSTLHIKYEAKENQYPAVEELKAN